MTRSIRGIALALLLAPAAAPAAGPEAGAAGAPEAAPASARQAGAEGEPGRGGRTLTLGARAGVDFPGGHAVKGERLADSLARAVPIEVRAGLRLDPSLEVGMLGGYAFGMKARDWKDACTLAGQDCSEHLWRLAAYGEYAWPQEKNRPFLGLALGWEWDVRERRSTSADREKRSLSGWTAGVEAGIDREFTPRFGMGLYAGFGLGQFVRQRLEERVPGFGSTDRSGAVPETALHTWLSIGLRGAWSIGL